MSTREHPGHPGINLGRSHGSAHELAKSRVFGFWVLMMSDLVLFGVVAASYAALRGRTAGAPTAAQLLELRNPFIESLVLLSSSMCFGMVTVSVKHHGNARRVLPWLLATLALGLIFLGLELHDFQRLAEQGAIPQRSAFLSALWSLVGLHGLHVSLGCGAIIVACLGLRRFGLDDAMKLTLLRLGIYWHLLDVVWVGVFSLVYLGARL